MATVNMYTISTSMAGSRHKLHSSFTPSRSTTRQPMSALLLAQQRDGRQKNHRHRHQQGQEIGSQFIKAQRLAERAPADSEKVRGRINAANEGARAFERTDRVQQAGKLDGGQQGAQH